MRFLICLFLALVLSSVAGIYDGNIANAAGKKSTLNSDMDDGLVVCKLNAGNKIVCNCKQGTQACTDMIKNSCDKNGASCAGGYCSCDAKTSFIKANPSLLTESVGGGTVIQTTPTKPRVLQNRQRLNVPANGTVKGN